MAGQREGAVSQNFLQRRFLRKSFPKHSSPVARVLLSQPSRLTDGAQTEISFIRRSAAAAGKRPGSRKPGPGPAGQLCPSQPHLLPSSPAQDGKVRQAVCMLDWSSLFTVMGCLRRCVLSVRGSGSVRCSSEAPRAGQCTEAISSAWSSRLVCFCSLGGVQGEPAQPGRRAAGRWQRVNGWLQRSSLSGGLANAPGVNTPPQQGSQDRTPWRGRRCAHCTWGACVGPSQALACRGAPPFLSTWNPRGGKP